MEIVKSMKMLEKGAKVLFGAMIAAMAPSAFAESATTGGADEWMETVTVIGTKTERKISDVAGSILRFGRRVHRATINPGYSRHCL